MVCVVVSSVVDRGFESRSGQTNDYIKFVCIASCLILKLSVVFIRFPD
jgi:hypothetical protein